jgi:CRP-like cAMP-binding protein
MEELLHLLDKIQVLDPALRRYLISKLKRRKVKKKTIILEEGQIPKSITFIEKGLVRAFRYVKGKDKTSWMVREKDIFLSVGGFFPQRPATENIETLGDCIFYSITYRQLEYAFKHFPQFERHGRIIAIKYYVQADEREHMRQKSAYEKYKYLMENQPDLVGRVQDKYLASYLGIVPETFSNQKAKYARSRRKR